ncbi:MAG TPA: UbiA family prenyltransferase [Candidatus Dormibacteraeota bacterium]
MEQVRHGSRRASWARRTAAAMALVHPGPSLLVTAVTVAAGGLAHGGLPSADLIARLVLIMLPAQFAIGAVNDLADLEPDRATRPCKPLVTGMVSRRAALVVAAVCVAFSLAAAAWSGLGVLLVVIAGLGAGLSYDLGLKRSPLAVLCWWAGLAALPLAAYTVAGAWEASLLWEVPLAGLLSVSLLCANALPDLDADRTARAGSLPVRLGESGTRRLGIAAALATSVVCLALIKPLGQSAAAMLVATGLFSVASLAAFGMAVRRPFPVVATAAALLAVTWFASLPR